MEEVLAEHQKSLIEKTKPSEINISPEKKVLLPSRPEPVAATPEKHNLRTVKDERINISPQLASRYFSQPLSSSLHDPQLLLSNKERLDFQQSLEQYSNASPVSIYLYIFDRNQQVTDINNVESTFNKFYHSEPSVAVVYYYMGQPERSQVHFGGKDTATLASNTVRELSKGVRISAKRQSSDIKQLDEFLRELSLHLFWIEKSMIEGEEITPSDQLKQSETTQSKPSKSRFDTIIKFVEPNLQTIFFSVSLTLLIFLFLVIFIAKKKMYFPKVNIPKRLALPNGTHCCASMDFKDPETPPSMQLKETEKGI